MKRKALERKRSHGFEIVKKGVEKKGGKGKDDM